MDTKNTKTVQKYDPKNPSTGYDPADLAALRTASIMPALATEELRFDSVEDASIFSQESWTTSRRSPMTRFIRSLQPSTISRSPTKFRRERKHSLTTAMKRPALLLSSAITLRIFRELM